MFPAQDLGYIKQGGAKTLLRDAPSTADCRSQYALFNPPAFLHPSGSDK